MAKSKPPHLWIKIVMSEAGQIGPGKIDLLRAIDRERSIAGAARVLGMSYRRAWVLMDETRRAVGEDVVATHAGGASRGGAELTAKGRDLIAAYDRICATANKAAETELAALSVPHRKSRMK
jgi:molybdate transport system regulatory protein